MPDNPTVDIFIPVAPNNAKRFPAALYSALTQTYPSIRVILFLDGNHTILEGLMEKWWYTLKDDPRPQIKQIMDKRLERFLGYQTCERGVIIRNPLGPSGSAGVARQWLFEWEEKSSWVKMLDSDDILTPDAVTLMMRHHDSKTDGIFCPVMRCSSYRYAGIMDGKPTRGHSGSGSMLFHRKCLEAIVKKGFVWDRKPGHDGAFLDFLKENDFNIKTIPENVIYLYLK